MFKIIRFNYSVVNDEIKRKQGYQIINNYLEKDKVILIIDSMDSYFELPSDLSNLSIKEKDRFNAIGPVISSLIISDELKKEKIRTISLSIKELGIIVDEQFGSGHLISLDNRKIKELFESYDVLIVPGGQAMTLEGEICRLGINTDLTAISLAASLDEKRVYFYGNAIYTYNPNELNDAILIKKIKYDKAIELAKLQGDVIDYKAIELAKSYQIKILFNSLNNNEVLSEIQAKKTSFNGAISVTKGFSKVELEMCEILKQQMLTEINFESNEGTLDFESIIATKIVDKPFLIKLILQDNQLEVFFNQIEHITKKYSVTSGFVLISVLKDQELMWDISKEVLTNYDIKFYEKEVSDKLMSFYVKERDYMETVKILHDIWIEED